MAVTLTVAQLAAALRVGSTTEETAEVTRIRTYAVTAITRHLGDTQYAAAPAEVVNEALVRLSAYLYDRPSATAGAGYAGAMRNSGAGAILLPYRLHRAGSTAEAVEAAQAAVGTTGNPVVDVEVTGSNLVVTFQDGTTREEALPEGRVRGLRDGQVTTEKLADDAVTGRKLAGDAVATGHIADDAVTASKIPRDAITRAHIGADQVGNSELAGDSVDTAEVVDDAVTEPKLAPEVRTKLNQRGGGSGSGGTLRGVINTLNIQSITSRLTSPELGQIVLAYDPQAAAILQYVGFVEGNRWVLRARWSQRTVSVGAWANAAAVTAALAGERAGDIAFAYQTATVTIYQYDEHRGWQSVASWARTGRTDTELEQFIETIVSAWAIQGNADGIPGAKTFDGLFKSEEQTAIPGANVTITFQVGNAADGDEVDETDAAASNFAISEQQAAETGAFLRCRYTLERIALSGFAPRDIELLLQTTDGTTIGRHNIKDEGGGAAQFPIGDAGQYRWAVRVVTVGSYTGDVRVTETEYHSAQPLADKPIEHIAEAAVSVEAEKRQAEDRRLTAEIGRVEQIKAIVNGLPAATVTTKNALQWKTATPYQQADSDRFTVPATGFVQFVFGNVASSPIMRAEDCVNRLVTMYTSVGAAGVVHTLFLSFDSARNAQINFTQAVPGQRPVRSSLATDIAPTTTNYRMLHWAPARAGGSTGPELPPFPAEGARDNKIPKFDGDVLGWETDAGVGGGLPPFPAAGSRDNKIPKFDGDVLGWETDAGGSGGGPLVLLGTGTVRRNPIGDANNIRSFRAVVAQGYRTTYRAIVLRFDRGGALFHVLRIPFFGDESGTDSYRFPYGLVENSQGDTQSGFGTLVVSLRDSDVSPSLSHQTSGTGFFDATVTFSVYGER